MVAWDDSNDSQVTIYQTSIYRRRRLTEVERSSASIAAPIQREPDASKSQLHAGTPATCQDVTVFCLQAWANVCLPQGDFSNECSLESFNEAAISQWSQEALAMANTTREVTSSSVLLSLHEARFHVFS